MIKIGVLILLMVGCSSPDLFPHAPPSGGVPPSGNGEIVDNTPVDQDPGDIDGAITVQGQLCTVLMLNSLTTDCVDQGVFVNSEILANGQPTFADQNGAFTAELFPTDSILYNAVPSSQEFLASVIEISEAELNPIIPMVRSFDYQDTLTNLGATLQNDTAQVLLRFVNESSLPQIRVVVDTVEGGVNVPFYDVETAVGWSSNGATGIQGSVLIPNVIVTGPTLTVEFSGDLIQPGAVTVLTAANQITIATVVAPDVL